MNNDKPHHWLGRQRSVLSGSARGLVSSLVHVQSTDLCCLVRFPVLYLQALHASDDTENKLGWLYYIYLYKIMFFFWATMMLNHSQMIMIMNITALTVITMKTCKWKRYTQGENPTFARHIMQCLVYRYNTWVCGGNTPIGESNSVILEPHI